MAILKFAAEKAAVAEALGTLDRAMARWVDALAHRPLWLQVEGAAAEQDARRRCCEAFGTLRYGIDDETTDAPVCLAVLGVAAELVEEANRLNAAKAQFRSVAAPLQRIRTRVPVSGSEGPTRAIPVLRAILRSLQRSDLNVHAAYRKVPVLPVPPRLVAYTRARTRAVYRKSVADIHTLLMNLEGPTASADRARLASLDPRETELALVRDHYDNVRANVAYHRLDRRGRGRVQIRAELPIVFPLSRDLPPPEVRFPAEAEGEPRALRERASELSATPFLDSVSVYRYASR
jgi:hypothetical protein